MCVFVCVYIYIYMYKHTYIYVCVFMYIYIYIYIYMFECVSMLLKCAPVEITLNQSLLSGICFGRIFFGCRVCDSQAP